MEPKAFDADSIIRLVAIVAPIISTIFLALINRKTTRAVENSTAALTNSESSKVAAQNTAVSVEKVHIAVNSERSKMLEKIEELNKTILGLATDKSKKEGEAESAAAQSITHKAEDVTVIGDTVTVQRKDKEK